MEKEMKSQRVVSLNLSALQPMEFNGRTIYTGIFKTQVNRPITVRKLAIDGDAQADLINHGGQLKAVYFYPSEHYPYWAEYLKLDNLSPGAMGENFTCAGLLEEEAFVGDRWRIGTAVFEITQPRSPCYKLALKFKRQDLVHKFLEARKPGFYASVVKEGVVSPGDRMTLVTKSNARISVHDVYRLALSFDHEPALRAAIVEDSRIPEFWREKVLAHGNRAVSFVGANG
jgi:MOSC domain-containing protein YiiM